MRRHRAFRGLPLAGTAVVGVVVGHWLGYVLAIPDPHLRAEVLAGSGHGYWTLAIKAAIVFGFAAFGSLLLRHVGPAGVGPGDGDDPPLRLALHLALVQVCAFVALEAAERLIMGEPLTEMFQHHIFLFGALLQVAAACLGALFLLWFGRFAAKLSRAFGRSSFGHPVNGRRIAAWELNLGPQALSGGTGVRSPPPR